jgi:hypothetical protein
MSNRLLLALSFLLGVTACSSPTSLSSTSSPAVSSPPTVISLSSTQPNSISPSTAVHLTQFNVQLPGAFRTQQTAQAVFAKLEITNGQTTVNAIDADNEGFVEAQGNAFQLSANVPDGDNWIATISFFQNKTTAPFLSLKTLFHVPITGSAVNINLQTHLTGAIAEALRNQNAPQLDTALDINALQSFVNGLTGVSIENNTLSFSRLSSFSPPTPIALDARQIASTLIVNSTVLTQTAGENLSPANFLPPPVRLGQFSGITGSPTLGIDQQLAINVFNGNLFFNTTEDIPVSGSQGNVNETLFGLTWNAANKTFATAFSAQTFKNIDNAALSLGTCNPTGASQKAAIFLLEREKSTNSGSFKAVSQSTGQVIWQYPLTNLAESSFTPVLKKISNCSCACDDEHLAIFSRKNSLNNGYRIYALREERTSYPDSAACTQITNGQQSFPAGTGNGAVVWQYPASGDPDLTVPLQAGGALSNNQNTFYALTKAGANSKLLHIDTTSGAVLRESSLSGDPVGTPAIGKNGTIYVTTTNTIAAFDPATGAQIWLKPGSDPFFSRFGGNIVVDYVGGKDIVYTLDTQPAITSSTTPKISAFYGDDGSLKWETPLSLNAIGQIAITGMLIGAEQNGERVIYVGLSDNRVYAIRDNGASGALEWKQFPDGSLWRSNRITTNSLFSSHGMTLRNNTLFVATRDGGDGQVLAVRALRVSTPNLPVEAPWPKQSGNLGNSGLSQLIIP